MVSYYQIIVLLYAVSSERASETNSGGQKLRDGANINKSLLALANCINALGKQHKKGLAYVPYRNRHAPSCFDPLEQAVDIINAFCPLKICIWKYISLRNMSTLFFNTGRLLLCLSYTDFLRKKRPKQPLFMICER